MPPLRHRSAAALLIGVSVSALIAGCSGGGNSLPKDYGHEWMSQMTSQLAGDFGGAGGQLTLADDNQKNATASVSLEQDLKGPYDVLAVCRSTKTVHIAIHAFTATPEGSGESLDTMEPLGEADIYCGATTRIPIDVPKGRGGIALDVSTKDRSGRALFDSFIVARGANP